MLKAFLNHAWNDEKNAIPSDRAWRRASIGRYLAVYRPAAPTGSCWPADARPQRAWRRPYHFFERNSRSAAASSICSARSIFSFAFSS
jgi:hypothetical protein